MESVEIGEHHVAVDMSRIADSQVRRVGIHRADRAVDLLFTGR